MQNWEVRLLIINHTLSLSLHRHPEGSADYVDNWKHPTYITPTGTTVVPLHATLTPHQSPFAVVSYGMLPDRAGPCPKHPQASSHKANSPCQVLMCPAQRKRNGCCRSWRTVPCWCTWSLLKEQTLSRSDLLIICSYLRPVKSSLLGFLTKSCASVLTSMMVKAAMATCGQEIWLLMLTSLPCQKEWRGYSYAIGKLNYRSYAMLGCSLLSAVKLLSEFQQRQRRSAAKSTISKQVEEMSKWQNEYGLMDMDVRAAWRDSFNSSIELSFISVVWDSFKNVRYL